MNNQSSWALRDGVWVNIEAVSSGLSCNCICPVCGNKMIAKKGDVNQHHFAHYTEEHCGYSTETAIHMMTKEIIGKSSCIKLPAVHITDIGLPMNSPEKSILHNETKIEIERAFLEKQLNVTGKVYITPDILIEAKGKRLIVEIFVSHEVDEAKLNLIKYLNISAIEIDLSNIGNISYEDLKFILIDEAKNKRWLYNNKANEIMKDIGIKNFTGKFGYSSVKCKKINKIKSSVGCYTDSCKYYCGDNSDDLLYCSYPKLINLK